MGFNGDHFRVNATVKFFIYILQVRCLAAPAGTIVDNLYLDLFVFQIDKCHTKTQNGATRICTSPTEKPDPNYTDRRGSNITSSCSTDSETFKRKNPNEMSLPKMLISKNSVVILLK